MSLTSIANAEPTEELADELASIDLFEGLPDAVRKSLCESSDKRTYAAGQTVYSIGQYDGEEFFVVLEGQMRVAMVDGESGAMVVEEFGPQSIFGLEAALIDEGCDYSDKLTVTAEEDLKVLAIETRAFRTLANGRPTLMRNVAQFFAKMIAATKFTPTVAAKRTEEHVFAALLEYVERDQVTGQWRIQKMPKHRELADKAGVDEAMAASAVAKLIQERVAIRDYPGLVIMDMNELESMSI